MSSPDFDRAVEHLNGRLDKNQIDFTAKFVIENEGEIFMDSDGARAGDDPADVTLTADVDTFKKILSGRMRPNEAFMTGKLSIDGQMPLAVRLGAALSN